MYKQQRKSMMIMLKYVIYKSQCTKLKFYTFDTVNTIVEYQVKTCKQNMVLRIFSGLTPLSLQ